LLRQAAITVYVCESGSQPLVPFAGRSGLSGTHGELSGSMARESASIQRSPASVASRTREERYTLDAGSAVLCGCALRPEGRRIAVASPDDLLRVWDTATSLEPRVLAGHEDEVNDCAISPNGTWSYRHPTTRPCGSGTSKKLVRCGFSRAMKDRSEAAPSVRTERSSLPPVPIPSVAR